MTNTYRNYSIKIGGRERTAKSKGYKFMLNGANTKVPHANGKTTWGMTKKERSFSTMSCSQNNMQQS